MVILFPGKKCKGKSPAILTHQGVGCTDQHRGRVFKTASCTMWEHKFHLEGHKSKEPTVSTHTRGLLLQAGWFQEPQLQVSLSSEERRNSSSSCIPLAGLCVHQPVSLLITLDPMFLMI